jgi:hypothetical protein
VLLIQIEAGKGECISCWTDHFKALDLEFAKNFPESALTSEASCDTASAGGTPSVSVVVKEFRLSLK